MNDHSSRIRHIVIFGVLAIFAIAIVYRYAQLMLVNSSTGRAVGSESTEFERGTILDRNGNILAIHTELDTVGVWVPDVVDAETLSSVLADILDLNADDIRNQILTARGYVLVKRTITPEESRRLRDALAAQDLRGAIIQPDEGRSYPEQSMAAAVLGYVGVDNTGLEGIEYSMDQWLSGPGPEQEIDGEAAAGNQVFLTIDSRIQSEADRLARNALETNNADSVMILAMAAESGEILAYSSVPSFNPNTWLGFPEEARQNRPIRYIYEPGSVFKIFSVATFMHLNGIDDRTIFRTTGGYQAVSPPIRDLGNYGSIDAEGIIKFSSNVGAAFASDTASSDSFFHMLKLFGFGEETGILLNGEERGIFRRVENWSPRSKPTLAIGQEISVTALQMVTAATVFANEGVLLQPQIVDRIVSPEGRVLRNYERTPVREVVRPGVAQQMLQFMNAATDPDGTASRNRVSGIEVSAKTGTAEVIDPESGGYSDTNFVASSLSILPTEDPQLIIYVVITTPRGSSIYGGRIAAPVASELAGFAVPYLGIQRSQDEQLFHTGTVRAPSPQLPPLEERVPDYGGLPLRVLTPLLSLDEVNVSIEGSGWVVRQFPAPGTIVQDGMTIRLELE